MTNSDDVRLDIETTRQQSRYAAVENRGAEGHPRGETHTFSHDACSSTHASTRDGPASHGISLHYRFPAPPSVFTGKVFISTPRTPGTVVSHVGPPTRVCADHFRITRTEQTPVAERVRRRCLRGQPL